MSNLLSTPFRRSVALLAAVYAIAYLAGAWLDLTTTTLALRRPGATEGNVYTTGSAGYVAARAWAVNLVALMIIEACLLYSALNAGRVAAVWLEHPVRLFAKLYVNPFARGVADRSALHVLSFVLAFPLLRLLAACNNLLIWRTGTAPLGRLIGLISRESSPMLAFWLVMAPTFYVMAFLVSPLAVRVLRALRDKISAMPPVGGPHQGP